MGKQLLGINPDLKSFIEHQKVFFVGTAAAEGRVNVSPKGTDTFRIINENKIVWLNLTGSGNETAAHVLKNPRMTIMFCAFEGKPMILRLYGTAQIHHQHDATFNQYIDLFTANVGARQIIVMEIDLVQTSCGFGVPLMEYQADRDILDKWADKQGKANIQAYWKQKNVQSIDGFETNIMDGIASKPS